MRKAIVNVSVGSWYPNGAQRLIRSLVRQKEDADRLFFINRYPPHSPTQQQVPYAFKPYSFGAALMNGYDLAIWLDASCQATRNLEPLWEQIEEDGYVFAREGWTVGEWANDRSLAIMGISRGEANEIPLCLGTPIGLNLKHPVGREFLRRWKNLADKGAFNGSHQDHRHDITCAGYLIHDMGLKITDDLITMGQPEDHYFFAARGM